jgi:hypothetical protein
VVAREGIVEARVAAVGEGVGALTQNERGIVVTPSARLAAVTKRDGGATDALRIRLDRLDGVRIEAVRRQVVQSGHDGTDARGGELHR